MLSIDSVRAQIERELAPAKPEPETKNRRRSSSQKRTVAII
jgi:hypothetical protein